MESRSEAKNEPGGAKKETDARISTMERKGRDALSDQGSQWNDPKYYDPQTTDLTVLVGPDHTVYKVHQDTIASKSDFFKARMTNTNFTRERRAYIPHISLDAFDLILAWLYVGDLPFEEDEILDILDENALSELIEATHYLRINSLMDKIKKCILKDNLQYTTRPPQVVNHYHVCGRRTEPDIREHIQREKARAVALDILYGHSGRPSASLWIEFYERLRELGETWADIHVEAVSWMIKERNPDPELMSDLFREMWKTYRDYVFCEEDSDDGYN